MTKCGQKTGEPTWTASAAAAPPSAQLPPPPPCRRLSPAAPGVHAPEPRCLRRWRRRRRHRLSFRARLRGRRPRSPACRAGKDSPCVAGDVAALPLPRGAATRQRRMPAPGAVERVSDDTGRGSSERRPHTYCISGYVSGHGFRKKSEIKRKTTHAERGKEVYQRLRAAQGSTPDRRQSLQTKRDFCSREDLLPPRGSALVSTGGGRRSSVRVGKIQYRPATKKPDIWPRLTFLLYLWSRI